MKLAELAFACHIYGSMTDYDRSYHHFRQETAPQLDLKNADHRLALIEWLNKWGCRQFARAYHHVASEEIREWYQAYGERFFSADKSLLDLNDSDLALVEEAYAALSGRPASIRERANGKRSTVSIGPTGTAKILFALRPKALMPWDIAMRKHFRLDGDARAYRQYLGVVREELEEIDRACKERTIEVSDLPALLSRPTSTPLQLIDEFFWVTVSSECASPSREQLERWVEWS